MATNGYHDPLDSFPADASGPTVFGSDPNGQTMPMKDAGETSITARDLNLAVMRLGQLIDVTHERIMALLALVHSLERARFEKEKFSCEAIFLVYLGDAIMEVRVAALKAAACLVRSSSDVHILVQHHVHVFVVRSFSKDQRFEAEREQAFKLVRSFLNYPAGPTDPTGLDAGPAIPHDIVRSIVAIAEHADDIYRRVSIETLCELAIRDVKLLVQCGGMRVLLQVLVEGQSDLSESLVLTITYLLNAPSTRAYLRPDVDIELLICNFTDNYNRGQSAADRIQACANTLRHFLSSWIGLAYLCANNRLAIRSMVAALNSPIRATQESLIDMLTAVFDVMTTDDSWTGPRDRSEFSANSTPIRPVFWDRVDVVEQHLAALVLVFVDCGLIEALITLIEGVDRDLAIRSSVLIGRVTKLSKRLLPQTHSARVQSLPRLFQLGMDQEAQQQQNVAAALQCVSKISLGLSDKDSNLAAPYRKLWNQNYAVRDMPLDEVQMKMLIQETLVLAERDYSRWNWDLIGELFLTFLRNPVYLSDVIRTSSFVKRILNFYRPSTSQFSDLLMNRANMKFLQIGCDIMSALTTGMEGVKYLFESGLVAEIAQCLAGTIPEMVDEAKINLNRDRLNRSLAWGYFWMIMSASKTKEGLRLLEKSFVFDTIFRMADLPDREDVVKECLASMEYTLDGYPRAIISRMLSAEAKETRMIALNHLRTLAYMRLPGFRDWGMRLLVDQLYDIDAEICAIAVEALDEACNQPENLEALIKLRPVLDHLGELAKPLFLRYLSSTQGFQNILDTEFVYEEMDSWIELQNMEYVTQIEVALGHGLAQRTQDPGDAPLGGIAGTLERHCFLATFRNDGIVPPHLYGALVRTAAGCDILRRRGHLKYFSDVVRKYTDDLNAMQLLRLKGALWAIGNIGAVENGLIMLEEEDIVCDILFLAENASILSVRGTCFYVLGLIAKTPFGAELLDENGWERSGNPHDPRCYVATPKAIDRYFDLEKWSYDAGIAESMPFVTSSDDATVKEIITAAGNLSNHILANAGSKLLAKLKSEKPVYFMNVDLYLDILQLIGCFHFRSSARKFLLDLFDIAFNSETLRRMDQWFVDLPNRQAAARTKNRERSADATEVKSTVTKLKSESDDEEDKPTVVVRGFLI